MTARSAEQDTGFRRRSFEFYLRTGLQLIPPAEELEQKFNPYHDPYNGRFTFAPGGSLRAAATGGARPQPKLPLGTAPNSPRSQGGRRNLDALSKQFETAAGNPGTVSTGEETAVACPTAATNYRLNAARPQNLPPVGRHVLGPPRFVA